MKNEKSQPALPMLARAYHAWSGLAVFVIAGIALGYVGLQVAAMLPGGPLDAKPYREALRVAEENLTALQSVRAGVQNLTRDDQLRLAALIPGEPDISGLVTNLHNLTQATSLILQGVDANIEAVPSATLPKTVGSVAVTVSLAGVDYPKLKTYLKAVSLNARLLDFVSVGFSSKTPGISLQLRTYYIKK